MSQTRNNPYDGVRRLVAMIVVAVALICFPLTLPATNPLVGVDWFQRQIGEGVTWYQYEFDDLFGLRQNITYIEADLNNPNVVVEFPHLVTGLQKTSLLVPSQFPNALAGVNGTYFNMYISPTRHNTYLRVNGIFIPYEERTKGTWGHHAAIARDTTGKWEVLQMPTTSGEWDDNTTHPNLMANGPLLVWNGVYADAYSGTHCTTRRSRTAAGMKGDNKLILLTVDEVADRGVGVTCEETAQILLWLGVVQAVNMDGGGTTTAWIKNEPHSGVVNYPSDSSGERGTPNAIAIVSPPAAPAQWDARLLGINYNRNVLPNQTQTVTFTYENIGAQTWTQTGTKLVTSRPTGRSSDFYQASWVSPTQPALMTQTSVAPGSTATFSFPLTAPATTVALLFYEHFMLAQEGVGRIGPSDSRARLDISVIPEIPEGTYTILVESRAGGQNSSWYSDAGGNWGDAGFHCTAPGTTPGIGTRYASTNRGVIGLQTATWRPNFPQTGNYHVSVAWPDGSLRRGPITYHVDHNGGRNTILLDQKSDGNTWYPLGIFSFTEGASDTGRVRMTNEDISESGNMWAAAVRFLLLDPYMAPTPTPVPGPSTQYLVENFEGRSLGSEVMLKGPEYSGSRLNVLVGSGVSGVVNTETNITLDPLVGSPGTQSYHYAWKWGGGATGLVRATTFNAAGRPNPILHFDKGLSVYAKITQGEVDMSYLVRETGVSGTIGDNGGSTGNIEECTNRIRLVASAEPQWQYVHWDLPNESYASFSSGNGTLNGTHGTLEALIFRRVTGSALTDIELFIDDIYQGGPQLVTSKVADWTLFR